MASTEYNFPPYVKGTTLPRTGFVVRYKTGGTIDLTGVTMKCQFKSDPKCEEFLKEITNTNGIDIDNPTAGHFFINAFDIDFPVGNIFYDIKFVFPVGSTKKVYISGILPITQNITN